LVGIAPEKSLASGLVVTAKGDNLMKPETIAETVRLWQAAPDKARGKPVVNGRSDNAQAVLEAGSFSWRADLPPPVGGSGTAPTPTALLLSALAGCAVVFIVDTLAPQLGVRVNAVHAVAQCEADSRGLLGMPDAAPDLQEMQLTIEIHSDESEAQVNELYRVWLERCPIYLALIKPLQVKTTLEIKSA
jgi:uncharacterized OsmC-like protein